MPVAPKRELRLLLLLLRHPTSPPLPRTPTNGAVNEFLFHSSSLSVYFFFVLLLRLFVQIFFIAAEPRSPPLLSLSLRFVFRFSAFFHSAPYTPARRHPLGLEKFTDKRAPLSVLSEYEYLRTEPGNNASTTTAEVPPLHAPRFCPFVRPSHRPPSTTAGSIN